MAILGCNFNINFGQTLVPGFSLCNTLRTKLHAWTESSIIVAFMVKFIWQHKLSPLEGWIFGAQRAKNETPPVTPKLKLREVSQSGFCNISLYPTSVPSFSQIGWPQLLAPGTLSQTMTLKMIDSSEKRNRRLGSELQNSHVCEKCDPNLRYTVYMKTHYFFTRWKVFSFKIFLTVFFSNLRE